MEISRPRLTFKNMPTPDIIILGAGGHGRVVLDILLQAKTHRPIGFLDNNPALHGRRIDGLPVIGGIEQLPDLRARGIACAVIAIGDNGVRRALAEQLVFRGFDLVNAIHPSAQLATTVTLGKGVVIAAGALVCAHCQIGDYAILNTGCIIDHESMIGCSAHICPGVRLAGHVTVESGVFVGIGATVVQNVRLGYESVVGAGAVVTENVPPMTTVVGVPARPTKLAEAPGEFASLLTAGTLPPFVGGDRGGSTLPPLTRGDSGGSEIDRLNRPQTPRLAPQPLRK